MSEYITGISTVDGVKQYDYNGLANAPMVADATYPNCYYRMVDGIKEWVNPPMVAGVEYRTTERYQGAAVFRKVDASGNVLWRKGGETQWHLMSSFDYVAAATVE